VKLCGNAGGPPPGSAPRKPTTKPGLCTGPIPTSQARGRGGCGARHRGTTSWRTCRQDPAIRVRFSTVPGFQFQRVVWADQCRAISVQLLTPHLLTAPSCARTVDTTARPFSPKGAAARPVRLDPSRALAGRTTPKRGPGDPFPGSPVLRSTARLRYQPLPLTGVTPLRRQHRTRVTLLSDWRRGNAHNGRCAVPGATAIAGRPPAASTRRVRSGSRRPATKAWGRHEREPWR